MIQNANRVYTIGYAGFPESADLIECLKKSSVRLLIDVRSSPFSAYHQQYDKPLISEALKSVGIQYRNFAREFGARQEDRRFYRNGRLDFDAFAQSEQFAEGVEKVKWAAEHGFVPTLMCAEKEPSTCHRAIMISRKLSEIGFDICHLIAGEPHKTQKDVENELLDAYFKNRNQLSIFEADNKPEEVLISEAYTMRNDEIGYRGEEP